MIINYNTLIEIYKKYNKHNLCHSNENKNTYIRVLNIDNNMVLPLIC
jgi:hypothetical protein